MAAYKEIPRYDNSGITEYYRISNGDIIRVGNDYSALVDKPTINGVVLDGELTPDDLGLATSETVEEIIEKTGLHNFIKIGQLDDNGNLDYDKIRDKGWVLLPQGKNLGMYNDSGVFSIAGFDTYNMQTYMANEERLNSIRLVTFSTHYGAGAYTYAKMIWFAPNASAVTTATGPGVLYAQAEQHNANRRPPALGTARKFVTFEDIGNWAQTISGTKTFTTLPKTSVAPTENTHFTNKQYVDAQDATKQDKLTAGTNIEITGSTINAIVTPKYELDLRKYYPTSSGNISLADGARVTQDLTTEDRAIAQKITQDILSGVIPTVYVKCYLFSNGKSGMNSGDEIMVPALIAGYNQYKTTGINYSDLELYAIIPEHISTSSVYPYVTTGHYIRVDLQRNRCTMILNSEYMIVCKKDVLLKNNTTAYTPTKDYHPATKKYIDEAVGNIVSFGVQLVDTLPTENISTSTVYMVPSEKSEEQNVKDEYLYTAQGWEMIGTTKVDLSNYYNKQEVDSLIEGANEYTDNKVGNLYLRCSETEYAELTPEERNSYLIAIVEE